MPKDKIMQSSSFFLRLYERLPPAPGIHRLQRYKRTAVLVPLMEKKGEPHLLFEERAPGIAQEGEICFPGGMMERKDKNPVATAIRESIEELGISEDRIHLLGEMDVLLTVIGLTVAPVVAKLDYSDIREMHPNPDEVARLFTLPLSWFHENEPEKYHIRIMAHPYIENGKGEKKILLPAEKLGLPKRYTQPWGTLDHPLVFWKTPHGTLWGLTAQLVADLLVLTKNLIPSSLDAKS